MPTKTSHPESDPILIIEVPHQMPPRLWWTTEEDIFDLAREGFDAAIHVGEPDWPGATHDFLFRETVVPVVSPGLARAVASSSVSKGK